MFWTDDAPVTSLPVNYKYFALAGVAALINWVKKTLGELIGPFKVATGRDKVIIRPYQFAGGGGGRLRAVPLYLALSFRFAAATMGKTTAARFVSRSNSPRAPKSVQGIVFGAMVDGSCSIFIETSGLKKLVRDAAS